MLIPPPTVTRSRHQNSQTDSTNMAALPWDAGEREQEGLMEDERMESHIEGGGEGSLQIRLTGGLKREKRV